MMQINIQTALTDEEKLNLLMELLGEMFKAHRKVINDLSVKFYEAEREHYKMHLDIAHQISALEKKK